MKKPWFVEHMEGIRDELLARAALIDRDIERQKLIESRSWYCHPCAREVYGTHCVHCGKTKRQRK